MKVSMADRATVMDEIRKGKSRRAVFPPDLMAEVDKLPPDERRWRLIQYLEEHGEDVKPGDGFGPTAPKPPDRQDPPE